MISFRSLSSSNSISILCCVAVFLCISVSVKAQDDEHETPKPWTWNTHLYARGIFPDAIDPIATISKEPGAVFRALKTLLDNTRNLNAVYAIYKDAFKKPDIGLYGDRVHKKIFKEQLLDIAWHNARAKAGKFTWYKGVNQYTDQSAKEFEIIEANHEE